MPEHRRSRENIHAADAILAEVKKQRGKRHAIQIASRFYGSWLHPETGTPITRKGIQNYITVKLERGIYWVGLTERTSIHRIGKPRVLDIACIRMREYLTALGYQEEQARNVFARLQAINPDIYCPALSEPEPEDSRDSYEGID